MLKNKVKRKKKKKRTYDSYVVSITPMVNDRSHVSSKVYVISTLASGRSTFEKIKVETSFLRSFVYNKKIEIKLKFRNEQ